MSTGGGVEVCGLAIVGACGRRSAQASAGGILGDATSCAGAGPIAAPGSAGLWRGRLIVFNGEHVGVNVGALDGLAAVALGAGVVGSRDHSR